MCALPHCLHTHLLLKTHYSPEVFTSILKNNRGFLPSLFCHTKPLQGEALSLSSVNASERGAWMCWLNRKSAEILIKWYMSLGPGSVLIACRLHYSCSLIPPLWCTALFHKEREESMCIYTHFLARGEWAMRKKRWMVLFTGDAKVKSHAGMRSCILSMVQHVLYIWPNSQIICLSPKILMLVARWRHFSQSGDILDGLHTFKWLFEG